MLVFVRMSTTYLISAEEQKMYTFRVLLEEMLKRRVKRVRTSLNGVRGKAARAEAIRKQIREYGGVTRWIANTQGELWEGGRKSPKSLRRKDADTEPKKTLWSVGIKPKEYLSMVKMGFIRRSPEAVELPTWKPFSFEEKMKIATQVASKTIQ